MTIKPINKTVVCEKLKVQKETIKDGLIYNNRSAPLYVIVEMSNDLTDVNYEIGDIIMVHAGGSLIDCNGKELYLFKSSDIAGVVENE
jgi:co-chaperonin GroES (HSP10)